MAAGPDGLPETWGVIVLAAGASSRMGTPKQLLVWNGETLLKRAVRTALAWAGENTNCGPVCVVLGANWEACQTELAELPAVNAVVNANWETGMGSSVQAGLQALLDAAPDLAGVLVTLCDQPRVGPDRLAQLWGAHQRARPVVTAASYNGAVGVPALFARPAFNALLALSGAEGAKRVIGQFAKNGQVARVDLPEAADDLDTPADVARLTAGVQ